MFDVKPLTPAVGAEVTGPDLKQPISGSLAEQLRSALWEHQMLVFREQNLDIPAQKRLTAVFGDIMRLPYVASMDGEPEVIAVLKEASERNVGVFGGNWHSDFSFLKQPPSGSVLNAVEVPEIGGDTLWANQVAAYDALPADLRKIVDGRDAIHIGKPYGVKYPTPVALRSSIQMSRDNPEADEETRHPAVMIHPHSGRKALFFNPIYTTRLDGMTEAESAPVFDALYKHCTRPEFCCRLHWTPGTVAIWDNRTTLHYAVNDYDGSRRLLYRTTFVDPAN
ncbi:TauD/TfdA dioxygenase family protein [Denitrobaculum tricleocarpae]|nr:TauD/TfdA family dioxygenase [Denitrobaculum tricleocarpae]